MPQATPSMEPASPGEPNSKPGLSPAAGQPLALVTGASSGIGAAFARELARRGYQVVLCGRRAEQLAQVATEVRAAGREAWIETGDLLDRAFLDGLISRWSDQAVEVLVNNAGYGEAAAFMLESPAKIEAMHQLHTTVPLLLCRAFAPGMARRSRGYIINLSSLAGRMPLPGAVMYGATKAMLDAFSQAWGLEVAGQGIRVQSLQPGFTHTDFHARMSDFRLEQKSRGLLRWQLPDQVVRSSLASIRLGRPGRHRRLRCVPGWSNHLLLALVEALPRRLYWRLAGVLAGSPAKTD